MLKDWDFNSCLWLIVYVLIIELLAFFIFSEYKYFVTCMYWKYFQNLCLFKVIYTDTYPYMQTYN